MKNMIFKRLALLLTLILVAPLVVQYTSPAVAEAAKTRTERSNENRGKADKGNTDRGNTDKGNTEKTKTNKPSLDVKKKTLDGVGATYQLVVSNVVSGSAITWYSTNERVATVDNNGLVTAVKRGTTVIKCRIAYTTGNKVLSCVIKVRGTSTEATTAKVVITNATSDDIQVMEKGTTYDFNAEIKPSVVSGAAFTWSVADPTIATVDANGVVTAVTAGSTTLTVSGSSASLPAGTTVKSDQITIKVINNLVTVQSVTLVSSTVVVIKFSDAINPASILDATGTVTGAGISITPISYKGGAISANPGVLKGVLSDAGMTLTITAANYFHGTYNVSLTSLVLATDGTALESYNKRTELIYIP